jgi:hypothetical protein
MVEVGMRGWGRGAVLLGLVLGAAVHVTCNSTAPSGDCVRCTCECSGTTGTTTVTFEDRDPVTGKQSEIKCTKKDDCSAQCLAVSAPTPVTATCAEYK